MSDKDTLHVILGAGGAIGTPLARELLARKVRLRTVSRSGRGPVAAETMRADLTRRDEVMRVIGEGSTAYLTVGLPYDRRVWREQWPAIMHNVVDACVAKDARLLFFDNVYMYGKVDGIMTEASPDQPCSEKGAVRAEIARYLQNEMAAGRVKALIARSADFYGPDTDGKSVLTMLVFRRLAAGKRAQVLLRADARHSYTYTPDCAKALCMLAEADDAFGQVWHMPTAQPPLTGRELVERAARAIGVPARLSAMPGWLLRAAGFFVPVLGELGEMLYQYDRDYVFDSTKFERRFDFTPTPYEEGIRATARWVTHHAPDGAPLVSHGAQHPT